jgi:argininosuccinate synthase
VVACHVLDQREEFVRDFVFPAVRAAALYQGEYYLGTSLARPCITRGLMEVAAKENTNTIAHGATGKGNDQVRFELGAYWFNPSVKIIAPWREWDFKSRSEMIAFAQSHNIPGRGQHGQALFHRPQPAAHQLRGRHPGRPGCRAAGRDIPAHRGSAARPGSGARSGDLL